MIKALTCFVAEGVLTDRQTNQVSAFGLIESIQGQSYPLAVPKLAFFVLWQRDSGDPQRCHAEFSITQSGVEIARQTFAIDFRDQLRHRSTLRVSGFVAPAPGLVAFRLVIPGQGSAEYLVGAELGEAQCSTPPSSGAGARLPDDNWSSSYRSGSM